MQKKFIAINQEKINKNYDFVEHAVDELFGVKLKKGTYCIHEEYIGHGSVNDIYKISISSNQKKYTFIRRSLRIRDEESLAQIKQFGGNYEFLCILPKDHVLFKYITHFSAYQKNTSWHYDVAQQYIEGETLREHLNHDANPRKTIRRCIEFLKNFAEDSGYIIIDIKAENIMVDQKGNFILPDPDRLMKVKPHHIEYQFFMMNIQKLTFLSTL